MHPFEGTWETTGLVPENLDAYLAASGESHLKEEFLKKQTLEVKSDGVNLTTIITVEGGPPTTFSSKIGERTEFDIPKLGKMLVNTTLTENGFISTQERDGKTVETKGTVDGDGLLLETTAFGQTLKNRMKRV